MNKIQRILFDRMLKGDKKLAALFEDYVKNMGHSDSEAKFIVESVIADGKQLLHEDNLADMATYDKEVL